MTKIEVIEKYRCESEEEAVNFINSAKENAASEGYEVGKASYVTKTKKSKGEIIDLWYVVEIKKIFNEA